MDTTTKRVKVILTGGTIAGNVANSQVRSDTDSFGAIFDNAVKVVNKTWGVNIEHSFIELLNLDSSNINPSHWKLMAECIQQAYDDSDAYILVHGTNTMGYTAAALSFALTNIGKPVIITGAQVPLGYLGSDATTNLVNALRMAVWSHHDIRGVMAVFGSKIITGTRVKKGTDFDYDPFSSFQTGSLGQIGRFMKIDDASMKRHIEYLSKSYPMATDAASLQVLADFDMDSIVSLTEFPGMSADIFENLTQNAKGVVLRSFGAGDPNENLFKGFEALKARQVPIVVTTQAPGGVSNFLVNEGGQYLREHDLAIPAHDMSIEAMTTKLGWLIAQGLDYETIKAKMVEDLHGEIHVIHELI